MSGITQHLLPYILFRFFTAFARVQDDVELQRINRVLLSVLYFSLFGEEA